MASPLYVIRSFNGPIWVGSFDLRRAGGNDGSYLDYGHTDVEFYAVTFPTWGAADYVASFIRKQESEWPDWAKAMVMRRDPKCKVPEMPAVAP